MKNTTISALAAACSMLVLILDGQTASIGAQEGVELCCRVVIPSLFPFLFLSSIFTHALSGTPLPLLRPWGKLCGIPTGMESLLIPAFLGGYPAGAQAVALSCHSGSLSRENAEKLLCFCSNAGPAFIFGLTASVFSEKWVPWLLWGIQILSACTTAVMLRGGPASNVSAFPRKPLSVSDALAITLKSMAYICGWVIVFRILISFLHKWFLWLLPPELQVTVIGALELSNGCLSAATLPDLNHRIVLCSVLLSNGGLCVAMQTKAVLQDLSIRPYLLGKTMQSILSLLFTVSIVYRQPILLVPILFVLLSRLRKQKNGVAFQRHLMYNDTVSQ